MVRFGIRRTINPMRLGMKAVRGIIGLWAVDVIVKVVAPASGNGLVNPNDNTSFFYQAYRLLGLTQGQTGGVLSILGIFVAVDLLNEVIYIRF